MYHRLSIGTSFVLLNMLARLISLQGINAPLTLNRHLFCSLEHADFTLSFDDMDHTSDAVVVSHPARPSAFAPPSLEV
ncbi:hypothetical protein F4604DRAFT_1794116 [Suillus subluteus]|nr:hypothetical protein F4604DRAFT_1794116 [Suillus subluteus]